MSKRARWIASVVLLLAIVPAGCGSGAATTPTKAAPTDPSAASENAIKQPDADACNELIRRYAKAIRDGSAADAVQLYLPETAQTAEAAVASDRAMAKDDPEAVIPQETEPLWHEGQRLFPPKNDGLVTQGERDRLSELSKQHELAVIMHLKFINGESVNRFIVK